MAMAYSGGFNMEKLKQSLYRKQERVEDEVKQAVEDAAEMLRDEARANVPVDTHNLESAIHITDRRTRRGNHAVDIEVSGEGVDARDVEEYATEIHENYQSYNPGPGTLAKRAADPTHYVGEKYMERAVTKKKKEAVDLVRKAVREAIS
jgi:hypothetical protein